MTEQAPAANVRSRRWAIGLLVCLVIVNIHFLAMAIEESVRQKGWTFDVEQNRVLILHDARAEPVKIAVGKPPSAFEFDGQVPAYAYYGVASVVFGIAALIFLLRIK